MFDTILRHPGPTPIPKRIELAMQQSMFSHRSTEFQYLFEQVAEKSKMFFGTKNEIIFLPTGGTAALEAACINILSPKDEIIIVSVGFFGEYFVEIAKKLNVTIHLLKKEYGQACSPEELENFLKDKQHVKAIFLTYNETSTGVLNPVSCLSKVIREQTDALIVVDGVSCIGAVDCQMDEWGIDIIITGSQKALMLPPGLALLAISERAWKTIEISSPTSYFLNLLNYRQWAEKRMTPNTPAITLLVGLNEVCNLINDHGGMQEVVSRHQLLTKMTREGVKALGLNLLVEDQYASPTVTTIYTPENMKTTSFLKHMKENYQIDFAGGLGPIAENIFRFGHMGHCHPSDILQGLSLIEATCIDRKLPIQVGSSLIAAQNQFIQYRN